MASIQCAIELYDGVSPVLDSMAASLDGLIGRFEVFDAAGGLMRSMADNQAIDQTTAAVANLAAGVDTVSARVGMMSDGFALAAMGAEKISWALESAQAGVTAISQATPMLFSTMEVESFGAAVLAAQMRVLQFSEAGQLAVNGLSESFITASESIAVAFTNMSMQIMSVFNSLGSFIRSFASSLPGYFSGPLASISSMFSSMAASARSSLSSITAAAGSAASSVRSAAASISSSVSSISTLSVGGNISQYSLSGNGGFESLNFKMDEMEDILSDRGMGGYSLLGTETVPGGKTDGGQTVINVQVSNENYISSEADVDAVLQEFEDRLTEVLLSSAEGVY